MRPKGSLQAHKTKIKQTVSLNISLKVSEYFSFDNTASHVIVSPACNVDSQRYFFHINETE